MGGREGGRTRHMYGVAGRLGERREGRGTKAEMGGTEKERESEPCRYMYMYQISTPKGGRYSSSTRTSVHVHCIYHKLHILLPF